MKKLKNVSASQINTYKACKRKWFWEKVSGHRGPPTESQAKGTAVHHGIETFINTGKMAGEVSVSQETGRVVDMVQNEDGVWTYPTDVYVEEAKQYIPEQAVAEQFFSMPTLGGHGPPCIGYIDVHNASSVIDWKTTRDFRWTKTPEELERENQAMIYARWHWETYGVPLTVMFVYIDVSRKTKTNSLPVRINPEQEQTAEHWQSLQPTIAQMVEDAKITSALDLEPTLSECDKYGGCPHKARCGFTGLDGLYNKESRGKKSMSKAIEKLRKKKAAEAAAGDNPVSIVPPDAPNPEVQPGEAKRLTGDKKSTKRKKGPTVFVDCMPAKGFAKKITLFEEWVLGAISVANEIAAERELQDWRLLGFADEKIAFQRGLQFVIENDGIPDGLVVSSWHPQAREALSVIVPHAGLVVRGLK